MKRPPSPDVRTVEDGTDLCHVLPGDLARLVGVLGLIGIASEAAYHLWIAPGFVQGMLVDGLRAFFAVVGLAFLWMATLGHEIRVGRGTLTWSLKSGPFRYRTQSIPCDQVRRFVVGGASEETGGDKAAYGPPWSVLFVEDAVGRRRRIGLWHRREFLLALAEALAARCRPAVDGIEPPTVEVVDDPKNEFYPVQPPGSRLSLTRTADGVAIVVPPLGARCLDRYFYGCSAVVLFCVVPWVLIGFGTLWGVVPWDPAPPPPWVSWVVFIGGGGLLVLFGVVNAVLLLATAFGRT
ncbi:MAG: hypothetical protein ACRDD1_16880, partial [Planctomycetia bacterium]